MRFLDDLGARGGLRRSALWLLLCLAALACEKENTVNVANGPACGTVDEGGLTCEGERMLVCETLGAGLVEVTRCATAELCAASLPPSRRYDAAAPPTCVEGCAAGTRYCVGPRLLRCRDDGTSPVDGGAECASAALCERAVTAGSDACPEPACAASATRCGGGEVELVGERCNPDRTGFETAEPCVAPRGQCNPATGACIALDVDSTEVTQADYATFLASAPRLDAQPARCRDNASFAPTPDCVPTCSGAGCEQHPQVCVDWCDAYAYCAAQGRRLCGRIGGEMNPFERAADASSSQWMNACSAGGQLEFGPGAAPQSSPNSCTNAGTALGTTYAVGTRSECHSSSPGYQGLFDLSGNVAEWEDSCSLPADASDASDGRLDACHVRGGSYASPRADTACATTPLIPLTRGHTAPTVGFRCCG